MIKNNSKICPENKEINPVTGRCVLKCKEGSVRNKETGKCEKIPTENKKGRPRKKLPDAEPVRPLIPSKKSQPLTPPTQPTPSSKSSSKSSHSQHSQPSPKSRTSSKSNKDNEAFELYYPDLDDPDFTSKITNNKEFLIHKIPKFPIITNAEEFNAVSAKLCGKFDKMLYQHFMGQFLSYRTPYRSSLVYHGVGVGKTCSAITIAEALLSSQTNNVPKIWVIMPQALKTSFKSQVFSIDDFDTLEGDRKSVV